MDILQGLSILFSWQTVILALGVNAIVFVVRRVVIAILTTWDLEKSRWWRNLTMPILPILCGGIITSLAVALPYPDGIVSFSGRLMYGIVAGFLSSWIYRLVKKVFKQKLSSL